MGKLAASKLQVLARIGTVDAFVMKLDATGAVTWACNYGGPGANAQGMGVVVDGTGNVYFSGTLNTANLTTPAMTRIGARDAVAFKLDATGAITWARNFGGAGVNGNGNGIAVEGSANVKLNAAGTITASAARVMVSGGGWAVDRVGTTGGVPNTSGAIGVTATPSRHQGPCRPATVVVTYPSALPPGTVYWKYGKTPPAETPHWYQFPGAVISPDRLSVTLTLTDGGAGDERLALVVGMWGCAAAARIAAIAGYRR